MISCSKLSKITIYQRFVIQVQKAGIEQFRAYKSDLLGGFCAKFNKLINIPKLIEPKMKL